MSKLLLKIAKYIVLTIIIVSIPSIVIYIDYNNDIHQEAGTRYGYSNTIYPENETQAVILGEYPAQSDISVFLNRSSPGNSDVVNYYVMNPVEYNSFESSGQIQQWVKKIEISDDQATEWLNLTTSIEGTFRLIIHGQDIQSPIETSGFYFFSVPNYLDRNLFEIVFAILTYILIIFGIIPYVIKRYRINRLKRRKQQELMAEEDEFYSKLEQDMQE